jgi:hypothetical protein
MGVDDYIFMHLQAYGLPLSRLYFCFWLLGGCQMVIDGRLALEFSTVCSKGTTRRGIVLHFHFSLL